MVDELRQASLSFPATTSMAADAIHSRQYAILSNRALEIIATLIQIIEMIGLFPDDLNYLTFPLIPKPGGGQRFIMTVTSLVRLWERLPPPFADKYVAATARPYWACGPELSAEDTVWIASAQ